jgi:hypothetical protein
MSATRRRSGAVARQSRSTQIGWRGRGVLVAGGRAGTAPAMCALQAICAHELRHALPSHPHPLVAKLGVDAGAP